jgi:hypothetical protein
VIEFHAHLRRQYLPPPLLLNTITDKEKEDKKIVGKGKKKRKLETPVLFYAV